VTDNVDKIEVEIEEVSNRRIEAGVIDKKEERIRRSTKREKYIDK
jgi:hypothetical protein